MTRRALCSRLVAEHVVARRDSAAAAWTVTALRLVVCGLGRGPKHRAYTGEGQRGDQRMVSGNASILRHVEEDRALRLFVGARGTVQYEGEFELEDWYTTEATGGGPVRTVIVFRLQPKAIEPKSHSGPLDAPR